MRRPRGTLEAGLIVIVSRQVSGPRSQQFHLLRVIDLALDLVGDRFADAALHFELGWCAVENGDAQADGELVMIMVHHWFKHLPLSLRCPGPVFNLATCCFIWLVCEQAGNQGRGFCWMPECRRCSGGRRGRRTQGLANCRPGEFGHRPKQGLEDHRSRELEPL